MKKLIFLYFLISIPLIYSQDTYTVDNRVGSIADYTDLQTAINKVPNGSVLLIQGSSINYGDITINKKSPLKGLAFFWTRILKLKVLIMLVG